MITPGFWGAMFYLIELVSSIYSFLIIMRTLLSWLGPLPHHPLIKLLKQLTDPLLRLIHRWVPFSIISGIDVSPMIALLLVYFAKIVLINLLVRMALPM